MGSREHTINMAKEEIIKRVIKSSQSPISFSILLILLLEKEKQVEEHDAMCMHAKHVTKLSLLFIAKEKKNKCGTGPS